MLVDALEAMDRLRNGYMTVKETILGNKGASLIIQLHF